MLHNIKKIKGQRSSLLALIGLIILFAFSMAMANGGKNTKKINVTMRQLSGIETKELIDRIPEILTYSLGAVATTEIVNIMKDNFGITELESPFLHRLFQSSRFYKGLKLDEKPPYPYLTAIMSNKLYHMPSDFNRLLIDNGLEINEKNIIEQAKAFVILALGSERVTDPEMNPNQELLSFPHITFLGGKRIKEYDKYWATQMVVQIKCKIGNGEIETWKFSLSKGQGRKGQFAAVTVYSGGKPIRDY